MCVSKEWGETFPQRVFSAQNFVAVVSTGRLESRLCICGQDASYIVWVVFYNKLGVV
jgi:hypothetical protein